MARRRPKAVSITIGNDKILHRYRLPIVPALTASLALLHAPPVLAGTAIWADASDVVRNALVATSIGVPVLKSDWNGAAQATGSIGAAALLSYGLKQGFPEWRPDRSDRKSFPSGHTSVSFAAAATLENRYGWEAGLPAHLAALFVGVARVKADKHHWYDVIAGAAVGEASGLLITRRRDDNIQYFPWSDGRGGGLAVTMRF